MFVWKIGPRWGVKKELGWEATQGNGDSHTNKCQDSESLAWRGAAKLWNAVVGFLG